MDDDRKRQGASLTPEEIARIETEADETVRELSEKFSPDEFDAWMEAYAGDMARH
ncbi:MAG: hypothetical protein ABSF54_15540 [Bryobacteraceae bacterium]|jgi:hypothetical protein